MFTSSAVAMSDDGEYLMRKLKQSQKNLSIVEMVLVSFMNCDTQGAGPYT